MQSTAHYEWIERIGGTEMDPENASYPSTSDKSWSEATPSGQVSEDPWATEGFRDTEVMAGLERAGGYVKDAFEKTREKIAAYREAGIEQVSEDVAEYTRSQPLTALLIAAGVGVFAGMLVLMGRK
jgi:hypothetical protein